MSQISLPSLTFKTRFILVKMAAIVPSLPGWYHDSWTVRAFATAKLDLMACHHEPQRPQCHVKKDWFAIKATVTFTVMAYIIGSVTVFVYILEFFGYILWTADCFANLLVWRYHQTRCSFHLCPCGFGNYSVSSCGFTTDSHVSQFKAEFCHKSCDSGSVPSMNKKNKLRYGRVFIVEHRNWVSRGMILGWLELDRYGCFANIQYHNRCVLVMLGGWARWRPYFQGS